MKRTLFKTSSLLLLAGLLFLHGCGKKGVKTISYNPAYNDYIAAFSSGVISRQSPIRVQLTRDVVSDDEIDAIQQPSPLVFEPKVKGKAVWVDRRTLEFRPDKPLPSGVVFNARLALNPFFENVPAELNEFEFQVKTRKQQFSVSLDGTETIDNERLMWMALNGSVTTADFAEPELVESMLQARQDGNKVSVTWSHGLNGEKHSFRIDSLKRKKNASQVKLLWSGKPLDVDKQEEKEVTLPAIGNFSIEKVEALNNSGQYLEITFSDPLKKNQDVSGLVTIKEVDGSSSYYNFSYTISGNVLRAYPNSRQTGERMVQIAAGIENILGWKLKTPGEFKVMMEEPKPEIKLIGSGTILPRTNGKLPFPFEAVSLKSVKVTIRKIFENNIIQFLQVNDYDGNSEMYRVSQVVMDTVVSLEGNKKLNLRSWNRHILDLSGMVKTEPGAIYDVELSYAKDNIIFNCPDEAESGSETGGAITPEVTSEYDEPEETSYWDNYEDENDNYWENRNNPCHDAYYSYYDRSISRKVLASDIGMIAKQGSDGTVNVVVTDLLSTKPLSGVKVELYNFTQQMLASTTTDDQGFAKLKTDDEPFMLITKRGRERGYLKMQDGQALSNSAFDVSGNQYYKGLKGYLYGERGVWRPGDSLYLTFVLEDKLGTLPAKHPVVFTVFNPRGQMVKRIIQNQSTHGFYPFTFSTPENAPTGTYRANVEVGGASFDKNLKIETVVPNRLKIEFDPGEEALVKGDEGRKAKLAARWLHGATAKNLEARVTARLSEAPTKFKTYQDYIFDDPTRDYSSSRWTLFSGRLDEEGKTEFEMKADAESGAPGMLRLGFSTKVFEPGGNFSTDNFSLTYHPYKHYVGIKPPKGDKKRGMLLTDMDQKVDIVRVNTEGQPEGNDSLKIGLFKLSWAWWWDQSASNISSYNNRLYFKDALVKGKVGLKNGVGSWKFQIKYPEWGRYLVRACDDNGHCTAKIVYIDWPGWAGKSRKENSGGGAQVLDVSADRRSYKVGDKVELSIPTGETGRALVSIENGTSVLQSAWVNPDPSGTTTYSFVATKAMTPNIYAHVTLIQPHAQTANDLPIRMYGIVPLKVVDPMTKLSPELKTADVFRPMEKASLEVSEANGKAMSYTVAVVDEGLLDLTRFKTPNPWNSFYAREALGVKTWDYYDHVSGAYGIELTRMLAIGGDGSYGSQPKEGTKTNRFRPVVKYLGPFFLKPGEKRTHSFKMPNYIGSVRAMVVAGHDGAYGATEKAVPVRKPLMVLGNLPRVLGPGESVRLPVSVFAMEKHVKEVSVSLEANDLFEVTSGSSRKMRFNKTGDELTTFDLKVKARTGTGTLKITARSGNEVAVYHVDVEVRNPNPPVTNVIAKALDPGQSWEQAFAFPGLEGSNSGVLEVSSIPPLNLGSRLQYLIQYPHGCVEQTTSSVFPQLYVNELIRLDDKQKREIDKNINAGIERLQRFQLASGAMSYWPGEGAASDWGTNYAGNFLIEAQKRGYNVPSRLLSKWVAYQSKAAKDYAGGNGGTELIQADRLYLLALAGAPELGAMNRFRQKKDRSAVASWRLAAAYFLAGQRKLASKIASGSPATVGETQDDPYTYGSPLRDEAIILECMGITGNRDKGKMLVDKVSKGLASKDWMSTQTTGYCLLAVAKFYGVSNTDASKVVSVSWSQGGASMKAVTSSQPVMQLELASKAGQSSVKLKNNSQVLTFVRLILKGTPAVGDQDDRQQNLNLEVSYKDMDGAPLDPTVLEQGTDFYAEVTVTNPGTRGDLNEIALSQIFPSGWEIHNTRLEGSSSYTSIPEYQDIRDDRVYTYFDMPMSRKANNNGTPKQTYVVLLNATYLGRFYLPTTYVEAMYDASISARVPGKWVSVALPKDM